MLASVATKQETSKRVLLLMGITLLMASLPHFLHLPPWVSLSALAMGGAGLFWGHKTNRLVRNLIMLCALLVIVPAVYLSFEWHSSDALISIIVFVSWLKVWEVRTRRDVLWLVLASWMIVGFSFIYSQSVYSVALLFGVSLLALFTILMSQDKEQRIPLKQSLFVSMRLMGMALPIMVFLFLFFPRVTGSLLDLGFVFGVPMMIETDAEKKQAPLSGSLELGDLAHRSQTLNRVLSAEFHLQHSPYFLKMPPLDQLFWRGPVLWTYDGTTWTERRDFKKRNGRLKGRYKKEQLDRDIKLVGKIAAYSVRMLPHNGYALYALDVPMSPVPSAFVTQDLQLSNMNRVRETHTYRVESYLRYRFKGDLSAEDRTLGLQLPEGLNPQMFAMVQQWKEQARDEKDIVNKAVSYLAQEGFHYTQSPPPLTGPHMMDDFVFNVKKGYATHYASAFVQMMRMAGLPARLVTGYKGATPFDFTNNVMVLEQHAYAWAEVWVNDDYGWTRIDPARPLAGDTRSMGGVGADVIGENDPQDSSPQKEAAKQPSEPVEESAKTGQKETQKGTEDAEEQSERHWFMALLGALETWFVTYDASEQKDLQKNLNLGEADWRSLLLLSGGSVMGLIGVFLVYQLSLGLWMRHRRLKSIAPQLRIYESVLRRLSKKGHDKHTGEGAGAFAERLKRQGQLSDPTLQQFSQLTDLFVKLHYENLSESEREQSLKAMTQKKNFLIMGNKV